MFCVSSLGLFTGLLTRGRSDERAPTRTRTRLGDQVTGRDSTEMKCRSENHARPTCNHQHHYGATVWTLIRARWPASGSQKAIIMKRSDFVIGCVDEEPGIHRALIPVRSRVKPPDSCPTWCPPRPLVTREREVAQKICRSPSRGKHARRKMRGPKPGTPLAAAAGREHNI